MDRTSQSFSVVASKDGPGEEMWQWMCRDSARYQNEAILGPWLACFIQEAASLETALAHLAARKLADTEVRADTLLPVFRRLLARSDKLVKSCVFDLESIASKDPACDSPYAAFLFFKGFHALLGYRIAHELWREEDKMSAYWVQSRCSGLFGVDIHPAARIGKGIFIDHATGIVVGETAVVGDDVSLLHGVTLGGTGKEAGDRHPKIGNSVTISANATILGNINVGSGAKIGACSVVLKDVPAGSTVVGNPAGIVRRRHARSLATASISNHTPE